MANLNFKTSTFGVGLDGEAMLTAEVDDTEESDALNDETFGEGNLPENDEWEIEYLSEQTESAENSIKSQGDVYGVNDSVDSLEEMVEKSIFNLMADDDFPTGRPIPKVHTNNLLYQDNDIRNIFGSNSPQNPFLQFQQNQSNIWGSFNGNVASVVPFPPTTAVEPSTKGPGPAPSSVGPAAVAVDPMQQLLAKLSVTSPPNAHKTTLPSGPLKNAKTVEELEAELLAAQKSNNSTTSVKEVSSYGFFDEDSANKSSVELRGMKLLAGSSCEPNKNVENVLKMQYPVVPPPNFAPPLLPPFLMNPQIRAAVLACLAAGKPLPPGLLPPPQFLRMPFMPPGRMPGPNNLDLKQQQQQHINRNMSQHPNANFARPHHYSNRSHNDQRQGGGGGYHRRDPYAGLMSRRERDWLVKIQTLQLQCENPLTDDYYWTMYQNKKKLQAQKDKGQTASSTADNNSVSQNNHNNENDNLEHRSYVPPIFEGSLGKVQVSSVTCPRQLIDVFFDNKSTPPSSSMPSPSPQLNSKSLSRSKKLATLLLDIENGYLLLLECEELLLKSKSASVQNRRSEKSRELADKIATNSQKCWNIVNSGEKFQTVLNSRKGRRLLGKLFQFLKPDDLISVITVVSASLSNSTTRKEIVADLYSSIILNLKENFNNDIFLEERNWSNLFNIFHNDQLSTFVKTKFGYALVLTLIYYCAKEKPAPNDEFKRFLDLYASLIANEPCLIAGDVEMSWFGRNELSTIVFWLTNVAGIDAFVVNRCENQLRNLIN